MLTFLKRSSLSLAIVATFSLGQSEASTLCGVSGVERSSELLPYVVGNGGLSEESLVLFGNSTTQGLSESFATSDPADAFSWLRSLPNDERNNVIFVDLLSISLGGSESGSDALHNAIEIAWALAGNSGGIVEGDRYRSERPGRGGNRETTAGYWIEYGAANYLEVASGYDFVNLQAIPEPTAPLLAALTGLGFLRRRRGQ